jgi:hypothetical protein
LDHRDHLAGTLGVLRQKCNITEAPKIRHDKTCSVQSRHYPIIGADVVRSTCKRRTGVPPSGPPVSKAMFNDLVAANGIVLQTLALDARSRLMPNNGIYNHECRSKVIQEARDFPHSVQRTRRPPIGGHCCPQTNKVSLKQRLRADLHELPLGFMLAERTGTRTNILAMRGSARCARGFFPIGGLSPVVSGIGD